MRIVPAIILLVTISSCTQTQFTYDGRTYQSEREALQAANRDNYDLLASIVPMDEPIGTALTFYSPSEELIRNNIMILSGQPGPLQQRISNYVTNLMQIQYRSLYEAIIKSNIFERVSLQYTDGTHKKPKSGESVLYLHSTQRGSGGWYFSNDRVKRSPVVFDYGQSLYVDRVRYWLDTVKAYASMK